MRGRGVCEPAIGLNRAYNDTRVVGQLRFVNPFDLPSGLELICCELMRTYLPSMDGKFAGIVGELARSVSRVDVAYQVIP